MKKTILILAALAGAAFALADNITLTNADASRLFVALRSTQSGLSPANTRNAALDINTLRPFVEAYEAGQQAVQQKAARLAKDSADRDARIEALTEQALALNKQPITASLVLFTLSDDEIKDAKVAPDSLAEILRFLAPQQSKK